MGWGFIFMCFALALGFQMLDLLFSVTHLSAGLQNAIALTYAAAALAYLARSLALAVQIIFGRRSRPMH